MKSAFTWLLVLAWVLLITELILLYFSPQTAARIPHIGWVRTYGIVLFLVSLIYGITRLYSSTDSPTE